MDEFNDILTKCMDKSKQKEQDEVINNLKTNYILHWVALLSISFKSCR